MKQSSLHHPLTTPDPRGGKSWEFCGSIHPSVTAAEVSAALLFVIPSAAEFPATPLRDSPRVRFSVRENRMKLANATNLNRKFGKPRDLLCALPTRNCF